MSYHIKYLPITNVLDSVKNFVPEKLHTHQVFYIKQFSFTFKFYSEFWLRVSLLLYWLPPIDFANQFLTYLTNLLPIKKDLNVV